MTVDSTIALMDLATDGDVSIRSSVCCRSAWLIAATVHTTSAEPVMAYASSTPGMPSRSAATRSSAPCEISSVTNARTGKPAAATSTSGP
jgi:hypothetical protein